MDSNFPDNISSSFSLLGGGLKDMDLDKIKTGFKGIGSAMNAIPLMIIVLELREMQQV